MTSDATWWAWKQPLSPSSKLVLLALAEMAGGAEHRINLDISIDELVTRTGLERRTVQRHLRQLEASNHIVREDRSDSYSRRLPNRWHLNVNELAPVTLDLWTGGTA